MYQALYRQWRPTGFKEMVGQEAVVKTLRNQVMSGRIAHAYLFCGSRGTGKTSTAKIMARAVNCLHPAQGDPCGACEACRALSGEDNLDILEIDAASNNGVDEIRDLRDKVKYPPQYGRYKVYIIDEVHMLSAAAFNALLKTLEEPPAHVVFILATTEPQKLPATILSRCQRFDFGRIPAAQIVGRLQQAVEKAGAKAEPEALNLIARAAEGGMRDALSILDMCLGYDSQVTDALVRTVLGTADKGFLFTFGEALQKADCARAMELIDQLMRSGREPQVFAKEVSAHLRALLLAQACPAELESLLEITQEDALAYQGQAKGFTNARLLRLLEVFMAVESDMRFASSPRIALEAAALRACIRVTETDGAALAERVTELEAALDQLKEQIASGMVAVKAEGAPKEAARPKAAPKPAAQAAPRPAVNGDAQGVWEQTLSQLKKTEPALFSPLKAGRFLGCQGTMYRLGFQPENEIFCIMLNKPARKEAIAGALSQAAGQPVQFEAVLEQAAENQEDRAREKGLMDALVETFGRDKVQVQEK